MKQPKIVIFVGHYGSGKTEMAINYAIKAANKGEKTTLVDLDIVNPFFRSSEVKETLNEYNIALLAPNFVDTTMDIPSLPAAIQGVFDKEDETVIFDVGGDSAGARALGMYKPYFDLVDYTMYFVINTRRPLTREADEIIELMQEIETKSRQKITHLVSNTNLSYETTGDIVIEGIQIVEEVSSKTQLPIAYISLPNHLEKELPQKYDTLKFTLELFMTKWRSNI